MQRMSGQRGFTIIEIFTTLSVLVVMLALGLPALDRFLDEQRLTTGANQLTAHLQFARGQAISRNSLVTACPSTDGLRCTGGNRWDAGWLIYHDPKRRSQPDGTDDVLRVVPAVSGLVMASGGRYRVRFRGSGVAYGTNLTIAVCTAGALQAGRAVIVSNPGRVRVQREAAGACPVN